MPSVTLTKHHSAFLERTARRLSNLSGKAVSKKEVLAALLDIAIEDEGVYDPETSEPLEPLRKQICQAERGARTASFDVDAIFTEISYRKKGRE